MYITEENGRKKASWGDTSKYVLIHDDKRVFSFEQKKWGLYTNSLKSIFVSDTEQEGLDEIARLNLIFEQPEVDTALNSPTENNVTP